MNRALSCCEPTDQGRHDRPLTVYGPDIRRKTKIHVQDVVVCKRNILKSLRMLRSVVTGTTADLTGKCSRHATSIIVVEAAQATT